MLGKIKQSVVLWTKPHHFTYMLRGVESIKLMQSCLSVLNTCMTASLTTNVRGEIKQSVVLWTQVFLTFVVS